MMNLDTLIHTYTNYTLCAGHIVFLACEPKLEGAKLRKAVIALKDSLEEVKGTATPYTAETIEMAMNSKVLVGLLKLLDKALKKPRISKTQQEAIARLSSAVVGESNMLFSLLSTAHHNTFREHLGAQ